MLKKIKVLFSSSLFLKILAIFLVGHIFFSLSMMAFRDYIFENYHADRIHETAYNYSSLIIDKLGTPPDTLAAAQLAKELNINIRFKNDTLRWTSNPDAPHFKSLNLHKFDKVPNTAIGFHNGLHVKTERGGTKYIISIERDEEDFLFFDHLLLVGNLIVFTLILTLMYFVLKRQLKPIQNLKQGAERISRGEFDTEIISTRNDELGQLINSFNTMSRDVRDMIKSREQLLLDVSHELRSPITRVKVALEFLKQSTAKENISSDIKEIEMMITEILETERLNSPYGKLRKKKIDIISFLTEIKNEFKGRLPGIEIENGENIELMGDPDRLKIVFRNIFENGLKYSSRQGKPVEVKVNHFGENIVIVQRDFGIGIPKEHVNHIFEPFYRIDKSRSKETGGYGLGLHLTKKIIEAHKGEIFVESDTNNGVIVTITFPAVWK